MIRGDANADKITIIDNIRETLINGNADDDHIIINSDEVSFSTVYGGQGDDKIDIASDAIYVSGGKGNDDIDLTSSKKHTIYGGTGDDAIDSNSTIALFINAGADEDSITLTGIAANSGIHSIDGGAGDDLIVGTAGKELIDGGTEDKGEDTIDAAGGDDTIYGRAGNDVIKLSSQGNALVHAGSGDDLIEVVLSQLTYNTPSKVSLATIRLPLLAHLPTSICGKTMTLQQEHLTQSQPLKLWLLEHQPLPIQLEELKLFLYPAKFN